MGDLDSVLIEPLARSHGRGAFCCGYKPIDNFVKNNARKDHELYKVRVFVAKMPDVTEIMGLYSLTLTSVAPKDISAEALKKFERVNITPAIYLAMIAISEKHQKTGLFKILMQDVFIRCLDISENAGAFAIVLDAVNKSVAELYSAYGFKYFDEGELKMYLSLSTLRQT